MINRRHIRVKVMQSVYATVYGENHDATLQEKFLQKSIESTLDLYVVMLNVFFYLQKIAQHKIDVAQKKHLKSFEDLNPSTRFVSHVFLKKLAQSPWFKNYITKRNVDYWASEPACVEKIYAEIQESSIFMEFMESSSSDYKEAMDFLIHIYKDFIAENEDLYNFLEDKNINWTGDIPFVNTHMLEFLERLKPYQNIHIPQVYKSQKDAIFALHLFRETITHHHTFEKDIARITPNWDTKRIARLDMILIKMGIAEMRYFPEIPVKVTLNEYVEISKEYACEKSAIFINGVLNTLRKSFSETREDLKK